MSGFSRRDFLVVGGIAALGVGLAACATDGSWVTLEHAALADLQRRLRGDVLVPGSSGFTAGWLPANGRYRDVVPTVVAQVADDEDVVTVLAWCREHGIPLVPRGGGHSYAGLSTTTGLVVDLSRLNSVVLDAAAGTMVTGGAATNRDIFEASEGGKLLLPGGTCLGVGIGGLTLGGGIGYHTHWAGLTSDHLTATRMVTASGEIVTADANTNPDLFWASRGGTGGTFGINTEFTFDLVPVPSGDIIYYRFDWRGADAALAMFSTVDQLEQSAPPQFVASGMAQATPLDGGAPRDAVDVMLRGQFLGSRADFNDIIAPLLAAAPPERSQVVQQSFWETARIFTSAESENHSWGDISRYTDAPLPQSVLSGLVDLIVDAPSRTATDNAQLWMLGWIGGEVMNSIARTETAYVHRGMTNMLRPSPVWSNLADPVVAEDLLDWTDAAIALLDPHTPRESYQNFPNRRIEDWPEQYFAENLDRLRAVKREWDPDNVFRSAQSLS